jgi:uncharacterized protein with von Willebrand factor type A (vWA) domain
VVFVGDASMSPYEIIQPGGSVEHFNEEPGSVWLAARARSFPQGGLAQSAAEDHWRYSQSMRMIQQQFAGRMFP